MSHYNGGHFNPAYHDSQTLEVDRSPSRSKQPHSNPYAREANEGGQRGWQQPEGRAAGYDPALERVPWGGWQEGSWRGRDSIPMGLLSPRPESPKWQQHELNHSTFQVEPSPQYDPSPHARQRSAITGNTTMCWRGKRRMSRYPGGETALSHLGFSEDAIRTEMENEEQDLVKELVALSTGDRIRAIRGLPMSYDDKKHIRSQVLAFKSSERTRRFTCFAECTESMSLSLRRCGFHMTSARQALKIWQGTFKEIGGKFGTGVLSYFLFLKWLLMLNVFSFLVNFGFITIPQLVQNSTGSFPSGTSFRGLELLTGAGYFNYTVLYYGAYSNESTGSAPTEYNMQLAYFFTISAYMVLCGGALIYSMASSFKRNYVLSDPTSGSAWTLLCTWDFNVTNERAVRQRKNNLRVQLKESLSENAHVTYLPMSERAKHLGVHLATWLCSTLVALGCGAGIYFLCQFDKERGSSSGSLLDEAASLLLPFIVSLINLVIPLFYSLFNKIEHYSQPRIQIYAIIARNVILKMSILGILCYYWMNDVARDNTCWESVVGQNLYRLVIVDFLFLMLGSFFGEFLSNVIGTKCFPNLGVPEFDIARNVLDLIYAQTLAWIGIYFSPLLPVIQIIKFFILFYLKKVSLTQNCQPPRRSGRAAQMQTIFIALLFFPSFLGACSMVAYTVWSLHPSEQCGPFRGLNITFDVVTIWMAGEQDVPGSQWFVWIYENVIRSEVFYFLISLIILVFIHILWQVTKGRKLLIVLLKQQIVNEGKDKTFLLEKLQALQKSNQKKTKPKKTKQSKRRQDDHSPGGQSASNGMLQTLLTRQRLEEDNKGVEYNNSLIPSDVSVSTTSSAMMQAMLSRQKAEEQDVGNYYGTPPPGHNSNPKSSALIQVMQARQRAEEEEGHFGVQVSSQDPTSSRSSAVEQVMRARQKAEEEQGNFFQIPAPPQNPAPLGSSALIQAMLARQQAQNEYDDGY